MLLYASQIEKNLDCIGLRQAGLIITVCDCEFGEISDLKFHLKVSPLGKVIC